MKRLFILLFIVFFIIILTAKNDNKTIKELLLDDGTTEMGSSPWSNIPGGEIGVIFNSPMYPAKIIDVKFYITNKGTPKTKFKINFYYLDNNGIPKDKFSDKEIIANAKFGNNWIKLDLSDYNLIVTKNFCVSMEWLTAPAPEKKGENAQFLGVDLSPPSHKKSWFKPANAEWKKIENVGKSGDRDAMIRVTIEY